MVITWIKNIEKRYQGISDAQDPSRWPVTKVLLSMMSVCYQLGVQLRTELYDRGILPTRRLECKVIAIGNMTAGGTGKTPMAMYIAQLVERSGKRVVIISRGYRGSAETRGGVVSDGSQILMSPAEAGDEPYMMAQKLGSIPVLVGRSRYKSGLEAVRKFQAQVVILDDAFQHIQLHRDLNLLLLDAKHPFGNGFLLPRGRLREPVAAANRADAVVYTRSNSMLQAPRKTNRWIESKPYFKSIHAPIFYKVTGVQQKELIRRPYALTRISNHDLSGYSVYAFAAIANNADFKKTIESSEMDLCGFRYFNDHHVYSDTELDQIVLEMKESGARWLITTEKDFFRIGNRSNLPNRTLVIGIDICFGDQKDNFENFILSKLSI